MIVRCNGFSRQPLVDQLARQPIEQLGMRRPAAAEAKVAGRADQPLTKMMMPDAIDHHSRSERIVRAGDPSGQCQAPLGLGRVGRQAQRRTDGLDAPR